MAAVKPIAKLEMQYKLLLENNRKKWNEAARELHDIQENLLLFTSWDGSSILVDRASSLATTVSECEAFDWRLLRKLSAIEARFRHM